MTQKIRVTEPKNMCNTPETIKKIRVTVDKV